uniref:CWH43-like N-terminal domain-containing protein n=1 Tax=Meloidogyne enterolobii TaxID=390850 RepID=A0A6V7XNU5_MELEN|nr:unnamed protein product [Meloidogyne enterolobii]
MSSSKIYPLPNKQQKLFSSNPPPLPSTIFISKSEKLNENNKINKLKSNRFPPIYLKKSEQPEWEVKELLKLNPLNLFFLGCIPPFFGAFGSIITALIRARLPSLSRIINLPMERIFWQFTFLFHIPLRIVEIAVGFYRYDRLRLINSYHVVFFYAFGGFATGFFITNVVCHSQSLYYLNPYGRISYYIKIIVTILFIISMPILFGAFILYWRKCITISKLNLFSKYRRSSFVFHHICVIGGSGISRNYRFCYRF